MRRADFLVFIFAGLGALFWSGCDGTKIAETPEQRKEVATQAGMAAALIYLAIDKPEADKAEAISVVVGQIKDALTEYKTGGFITSLDGIKAGIDKLFPGEGDAIKRLAAGKLAKVLLEELDNLFKKHPDWKEKGAEVASLVAAFCAGAQEGFEGYKTRTL